MIHIAVIGVGVVGSGVMEVLNKNRDSITKKVGEEICVKYVLERCDIPDNPYRHLFVYDFNVILNDPQVRVVAEVMGGVGPAYEFTKKALLAGKHVVTSNKELVATHGTELLAIASEKNVNYLFEASVGGGIPIIRPLNQCLAANEITDIEGILNGTTNYILTQMIRNGVAFDDALAQAQQKGYAERNPAADIEGHDACRKISILSSLVFGKYVSPQLIHTEGITKLTLADVDYAAQLGSVIRLLGRAKKLEDGRVFVMVSPCIIQKEHPLSSVEDVFNGIVVRGDAIGDAMFYGRGAGKLPTASAVVADIMDAVLHSSERRNISWEAAEKPFLIDKDEMPARFYFRLASDNPGLLAERAQTVFGEIEVLSKPSKNPGELAFVTPEGKEGALLSAMDSLLESQPNVVKLGSIRILC